MIVENSIALSSCPFCGYDKILVVKEKDYNTNIRDPKEQARAAEVWFHCVCLKCKVRSEEKSSIEQAAATWNQRKEDADKRSLQYHFVLEKLVGELNAQLTQGAEAFVDDDLIELYKEEVTEINEALIELGYDLKLLIEEE